MHIIKSIGKQGVKTNNYRSRRVTPHPGDVVDFGENDREYPFNTTRYGRIESLDYLGTGKVHVCCNQGSVFLMDSGNVSISGGPFTTIDPAQLEPTFNLKTVRFWNWGDHAPGANQGVEYWLVRPVFRLVTKETQNENPDTIRG